jgi:NAD(P)-dependent dehydrogenase (short-subunit alcohol dehydrogenase family)
VSDEMFSLVGRIAVVTGGTGAIGSAIAAGLAQAGARVIVVARHVESLASFEHTRERGADSMVTGLQADVLDRGSLESARDTIVANLGELHILVNCAGGNRPAATLADDDSPFELSEDALREVVELNLLGTVLPVQVFGPTMPSASDCSIVNVSSMAAEQALTRVGAYGAAKAAVESYTRWLAVELARRHQGIRVNAIAPGFFVGNQNRSLLLTDDGELTDRGTRIIEQTPLARFGEPDDLVTTVIWLVSDGARFVTGVVVPVDGGFSAFAGV